MRILFVTARFPFPPLKGDQVRAYHQLCLLSKHHEITLVTFADRHVTIHDREEIAKYCKEIITVPYQISSAVSRLLQHSFSDYPFQSLLYQTALMEKTIHETLKAKQFDLVHLQLARMAPYLESFTELPRVIDLIDALSLNMERRYRRDKSPLRYAAYLEWQRLRQYEQKICRTFDQVTVVSQTDKGAIGNFSNLHINSNGVDLSNFPFVRENRQRNSIVFSGNMSYFPNVDAVLWFVNKVLPLIKAEIPDVHFYIVGTNPHPKLHQIAEHEPAVTVTGYVPKVQTYLAQATVAVVPMQSGSGMQFKVIEAMASGTPVIVTSFALGGLSVTNEKHLLIADTPGAFAESVVQLLLDSNLRQDLAIHGRKLVEESYTWDKVVKDLEDLYALAINH